jgi:hypothetical protein
VFACVRGCSVVWRPQKDRRGRQKGPQKDRSRPRVDARIMAMGESPEIELVRPEGLGEVLALDAQC